MKPTIKHTAIKGRPLIEIVTTQEECGIREFGISYNESNKTSSCIKHYGTTHNVEFPLERIIKDYITHYGITKAIEILIGKAIINSENRPILII